MAWRRLLRMIFSENWYSPSGIMRKRGETYE
jgi:hypothetical protein